MTRTDYAIFAGLLLVVGTLVGVGVYTRADKPCPCKPCPKCPPCPCNPDDPDPAKPDVPLREALGGQLDGYKVWVVVQDGCPPCDRLKVLLKRASLPVPYEVVDARRSRWRVKSTPTAVLTLNGKEVRRWDGDALFKALDEFLPPK